DRNAIKSEMGQLGAEIDRIARATQFNGKNLLDGSLTATKSATLSVAATGLGSMADTLADVQASTSFGTAAAAGDYQFTITNTGTLLTDMGINAFTATAAGTNAAGFYQVNGETATHALTATATQLTAGSGTSAVSLDSTTIGTSVTGTVASNNSFTVGFHDKQA